MTFVHSLVEYLTQMWHEFARTVHLESKKGKTGFWHELNMWMVAIPIGWVLLTLGLLSLFAAILMIAPIGKLFGYDLASFFAKTQAKIQDKIRPAQWIPFMAQMHSSRQKWSSITPAEEVYKNIIATVKNLEGKKKSGESVEVVETDKKNMCVKVHIFSPMMKWLDVMEIKCDVGDDMGGSMIDAFSCSTGFGPLCLPPFFGVACSMIMFWLPFSDAGKNKSRLDDLRSALKTDVRLMAEEKGKAD